MLAQDSVSTPVLSGWVAASLPFLLAALFLVGCACAAGVWVLVQRSRDLARVEARLASLEHLRTALDQLVSQRDVLDLRRLEHVLIEIRDGQRRLEDALLRVVQSSRGLALAETASASGRSTLADRAVNRLLALGYERVQLVTPLAELEALAAADAGAAGFGEILVEARRDGILCKGRVLVRDGLLSDVEMKPALAVFP